MLAFSFQKLAQQAFNIHMDFIIQCCVCNGHKNNNKYHDADFFLVCTLKSEATFRFMPSYCFSILAMGCTFKWICLMSPLQYEGWCREFRERTIKRGGTACWVLSSIFPLFMIYLFSPAIWHIELL